MKHIQLHNQQFQVNDLNDRFMYSG